MRRRENPLNTSRAASKIIEYYKKKGRGYNTVHMVLADFCP